MNQKEKDIFNYVFDEIQKNENYDGNDVKHVKELVHKTAKHFGIPLKEEVVETEFGAADQLVISEEDQELLDVITTCALELIHEEDASKDEQREMIEDMLEEDRATIDYLYEGYLEIH
jgi:hypothetical protein